MESNSVKSTENLNPKFAKAFQKLQEENFSINFLKQIFDDTANLLDYSAHSLHIGLDTFLMSTPISTDSDLNNVINAFGDELSGLINELKDSYNTIRDRVLSPFQIFATDYKKSRNKFADTINKLLLELEISKENVNKAKEEYFKAASKKEKAETTLKVMIKSIEKGNFSFNDMIKVRTGLLII